MNELTTTSVSFLMGRMRHAFQPVDAARSYTLDLYILIHFTIYPLYLFLVFISVMVCAMGNKHLGKHRLTDT